MVGAVHPGGPGCGSALAGTPHYWDFDAAGRPHGMENSASDPRGRSACPAALGCRANGSIFRAR